MSVRSCFFAGLLAALAASPLAAADAPLSPGNKAVQVVRTTDLQRDGDAARERNLPILMMFSMDGCGYCELVEQDFLRPMLISGDYRDKVIIRMVKTDSFRDVRDFNGRAVDVDELAQRYRAYVMPTVVLVDHQGRQLTPRLVGVTTPDFYGGDLDNAIDAALGRLQQIALGREQGATQPAN